MEKRKFFPHPFCLSVSQLNNLPLSGYAAVMAATNANEYITRDLKRLAVTAVITPLAVAALLALAQRAHLEQALPKLQVPATEPTPTTAAPPTAAPVE